jgi:hypothetical protein
MDSSTQPASTGAALLARFQSYIDKAYYADGELQGIYNAVADALEYDAQKAHAPLVEALRQIIEKGDQESATIARAALKAATGGEA